MEAYRQDLIKQETQAGQKPPKTRGLPVIGSIPQVMRHQIHYLEQGHKDLGDIFTLDLGVTNMLILNHPDYAHHVLRENARNYTKGGALWDMVRGLLGNGLPVSEGEFWKRQRRMMQPQFHRQRLEALTVHMTTAIDEGLDEWEALVLSGSPVNLATEFANITMKVIVRTMFGTGLSREDADSVAENLSFALDYMLRGMVTDTLPSWVPIVGRRRYQQVIKTIDKIILDVIERRRAGELSDDLISMLLHMVDDETGEQMTNQQLRDEAVSIFLAGYETTSVAMTWSMHFLSQNPDLMSRMQGEVDGVLGSKSPEFADVPRLVYPRWVMQEALRLYSPVFFVWRRAEDADVIDGYRVEAGQDVAVLVHNIHRHKDHWTDPDVFDPERFSPERSEGRHQLAWMPFGTGQRQCIGRDMALMEGQLILAKMMQRYEIEAIPERVAQPHIGLTLRTKDGLWVKIKQR